MSVTADVVPIRPCFLTKARPKTKASRIVNIPVNIPANIPETLIRHLVQLQKFAQARGVELYLVGGSVRDLLLNRPTADLDFALATDAIPFAKAFAAHVGGAFVGLDERPPTARVVLKKQGISMDFAQFRAASLSDDLQRRDLTINAMAISLEAMLRPSRLPSETNVARGPVPRELPMLIDPGGGMADLTARQLRFPSEQVIHDDPLRLIRIYRFAAQLNFEICHDSRALIQKHHALLPRVSPERIRDELMKILQVAKASPYLQEMWKVGLLTQIVEPSPTTVARGPVPREPWSALDTFEATTHPHPDWNTYLKTELGWEVNRRSLLKLCLLLQGELGDVAKRLKLSRKASQFLKCLASEHQLLASEQLTRREIIRFLRRTESDWLGALLFASALHGLTDARITQIVDIYHQHFLPILKQGRLITGEDLIHRFNLKEGREIGRLLKQIEERQFDGEIRTREEAFAAAEALIQSLNAP